MTVWAGYYLRESGAAPPDSLSRALANVLSRRPEDSPQIVRLDRAVFVYVETGAFNGSSLRVDEGSAATLVAGEPLTKEISPIADATSRRDQDITRLHETWTRGDFDATACSAGTFAAVHYDQRRGTLSLIADKLGVRPIYYAITPDVVYFAGALRILEALGPLEKVMDLQGAVETLALGYPLADRTPYQDMFAIRDGEIVAFHDREIRRNRYWQLASVREQRVTLAEAAECVHQRFSDAIERRLGGDRHSVAFLSGGLDSRCMVAELAERGVRLHTFNFADEGTQDQILGDAFARIAGTEHSRIPRPPDPVRWSMTMAEVWGASRRGTDVSVERPSLVWSGDGGSVGLGFVGVYESVISLLREGKRDAAVTRYFAEHEISVPLRVFRRHIAASIRELVHRSVREALDEVRCEEDPGRELFFFRMAHDQRRHLALHFEDVDLHRLEFHLPFYDADLIAAVAAFPADYGVGHRLYHAALKFFPGSVGRVAWQAYPGHEPCPIPPPPGAIEQWGNQQKDMVRRRRRASILGETAHVLFSGSFPGSLLDRGYLIVATLAHWMGVGDYAYAVDYAKAFTDMWSVSSGRWALPADETAPG